LVQISLPIAAGLFVYLQIALEMLAFGSLFAGVHRRARKRYFDVRGMV
jgi:hypothetical protein